MKRTARGVMGNAECAGQHGDGTHGDLVVRLAGTECGGESGDGGNGRSVCARAARRRREGARGAHRRACCHGASGGLRNFEGLCEIGDDVGGVFEACAEANEAIGDAGGIALGFGHCAVGHRHGVSDERFGCAEIFGEAAQTHGVHEFGAGLEAAANFEGDDAAVEGLARFARRCVLAQGEVVLGEALEAWVPDVRDGGVSFEKFGDLLGIFAVLAQAKRQGFETFEREPGFEGGLDAADGFADEAETIAEYCVGGGECAAHGDVVAFDVFGGGVDADVGAEIERAEDDGREEGVVDGEEDFLGAGDARDGGDVGQDERGVGGGFDEDEFGAAGDGAFDVARFAGVNEGHVDVERAEDLLDEANGAAVEDAAQDGVVAGFEHAQEEGADGGHACGEGGGVGLRVWIGFGIGLKRGEGVFESGDGGVAGAAVGVAFVGADSFVQIGGALDDGGDECAGGGAGGAAAADGEGGDAGLKSSTGFGAPGLGAMGSGLGRGGLSGEDGG